MKNMRTLLIIAFLVGAPLISYGQGAVNFSAGAYPVTRIWTNSSPGGPSTGFISGAGNYFFALFVAPTSTGTNYSLSPSLDPSLHGFTFLGAYGTNTATEGRFNGNPSIDGVSVPGIPPGNSVNFVVVGWSANIAGPNFASFLAWWNNGNPQDAYPGLIGWAGHSVVVNVLLGGGIIPQGQIFGPSPGQAQGFGLLYTPVPEPSAFVLTSLAIAAVLLDRLTRRCR